MPCAKKQIMEFQTFKKIVDQLIDLECLSILITGGEVFLNPQFKEMYLYAKKKGFIVSINTNGSLLNDDLVDLFAKYKPFSIEISLYGYDNESYYNFTGIPNSFNIVNKNILKLKQENINVKLKTVLTKKNYKYLNELKNYCKSIHIPFRYDYIVFPKVDSKKLKANDERLSIEELINILKTDPLAKEHFQKKISCLNCSYSKNVFECIGGEEGIYITSSGNICMCVVLNNNNYNINNISIKECISNFKKIKELEYSCNSKCRYCLKKSLCRYCPARFKLETNDYNIKAEWYCEMAHQILHLFDNQITRCTYKNLKDEELELMFNLLKDSYNITSDDKKDIWKNNIINNKKLNTNLIIENNILNGYIQFEQKDNDFCICEIQIENKFKGDHKTFRRLIGSFLEDILYDENTIIYVNINPKNKKSIEVFTKIGFKNSKNNTYEINVINLLKWYKRS